MQASPIFSDSPSSDGYSSRKLAEIAARVIEELLQEQGSNRDRLFKLEDDERQQQNNKQGKEDGEDGNDDFEFSSACREPNSSPMSADEIFCNGQIKPVYPVLNTNIRSKNANVQYHRVEETSNTSQATQTPRGPLRTLSLQDREELQDLPPGTYSVWRPKSTAKKRNARESSIMRKFWSFLHRSDNGGKESFAFLARNRKSQKRETILKGNSGE